MKVAVEGDLLKEFKKSWNERMQWLRLAGFFIGGLFILLGSLFMFSPLKSAQAMIYVIATCVMCLGVARFIGYFMAPPLLRFADRLLSGIFNILIGALLLQMPAEAALTILSFAIGIYLLVSGVTKLTRSAQLRVLGIKECGWLVVDGAFKICVALLFFAMPMMSVAFLNVVLGLYLLIDGLSIIIESADSKAPKAAKKTAKKTTKKLDDAKEAEVVHKK